MVEIKEEFRNRLEAALAHNNMKPVDLAKATGISESTISQYRSGYSKPKDKRLVVIANALHVDPTWLMGIDVPMKPTPVYEAAAGQGRISDAPVDTINLKLQPDQTVFTVKGRSMEPTLQDGDKVVITAQSVLDYDRRIALVKVNGEENTLKRIQVKDNGLLLVGDNTAEFPPQFYTAQEVNDLPVKIMGVVSMLLREVK